MVLAGMVMGMAIQFLCSVFPASFAATSNPRFAIAAHVIKQIRIHGLIGLWEDHFKSMQNQRQRYMNQLAEAHIHTDG